MSHMSLTTSSYAFVSIRSLTLENTEILTFQPLVEAHVTQGTRPKLSIDVKHDRYS